MDAPRVGEATGPATEQGLDEAVHLAVGPWCVGTSAEVTHTQLRTALPPGAVARDAAQLLHVDLQRIAGSRVLVATHRRAGDAVQLTEPVQIGSAPYGVDGGPCHSEHPADAIALFGSSFVRSTTVRLLARQELSDSAFEVPGWRVTVSEPGFSNVPIAADGIPGCRGRHTFWGSWVTSRGRSAICSRLTFCLPRRRPRLPQRWGPAVSPRTNHKVRVRPSPLLRRSCLQRWLEH